MIMQVVIISALATGTNCCGPELSRSSIPDLRGG
jgi:hypothetical protein